MTASKKVLLIAYLFPPIGGGGVQRALKMAKYLGQFGWQVHVLTVDPRHHVSLDDTLLEQLPQDVQIHRTKEWVPWNRKHAASGASHIANPPANSILLRVKSLLKSTLKKIKNTLLVPDDQILWFPYAVREGLKVMRQQQIDVIFSTSGPITNHLVAQALKRKTGKGWIADFRDPWTQNMHHQHAWWRKRLEQHMERSVLRETDCLLTVTNSFAKQFKIKYPADIRKVEVIHNGYDHEDYQHLHRSTVNPDQTYNKCTFIYTGIFYKERNPRLLLQAVAELIKEEAISAQHIKLQFAGVFDYPGNNDNISCVQEHGLQGIVEIMGHLPHQQALQAMKDADVLMLVNDTHPTSGDYIPGKLYEYMAIGHPILALSLPGESTQIIEQYELGVIVNPTSISDMKEAVLKLYHNWANNQQQADGQPDDAARTVSSAEPPRPTALIYERKEQARLLAELMNELIHPARF